MKLIYQYADGRRSEDAGDFHAYAKALDAARIHFKFKGHPGLVAAYLRADSYGPIKERFVRTYLPSETEPGHINVLTGYHPVPEPQTVVPGLLWPSGAYAPEWARTGYLSPRDRTDWRDMPEVPGDQIVQLTQRAYDHEIDEADRKGYNRGFKVGIAHRNRERAAQLRRQADSLERVADLAPDPQLYAYQEAARLFFLRDWGNHEDKARLSYTAPLNRNYLPGSVRAGVNRGDG